MSEDNRDNEGKVDVPSNFKSYTIQDRKIMLQQPKRVRPKIAGELYDGLKDAKKIDLANPGEESRPIYIVTNLNPNEEELSIATLKEYKDVFACSYKDPKIYQHTIPMKDDAKPRKQRPYLYNDNFGRKIKEEIWKVVRMYQSKTSECYNSKGQLFTYHVLERVARKQAYRFLDKFSSYNQLSIALQDQHKTTFAMEWGIFCIQIHAFWYD